jgi:hypothetical protein
VVEADYLSWDDRTLSVESDWYRRALRAAIRINGIISLHSGEIVLIKQFQQIT